MAGALIDVVVAFMLRLLVYTSLRIVRNEENKLERTAVIMSLLIFVSFNLEWRYDIRGLYVYMYYIVVYICYLSSDKTV